MADQWVRTIKCWDHGGRERVLRVFPSIDGKIVIQAPPGESAALDRRGLSELRDAITELAAKLSLSGGQS